MSPPLDASISRDGNKSDKKEEAPVREKSEGSDSGSEQEESENNSKSDSENSDTDEDVEENKADDPDNKRKRPFFDDLGKETVKRLQRSYNELGTQIWTAGAFTNAGPITLGFNHLETCIFLFTQLLSGAIILTVFVRTGGLLSHFRGRATILSNKSTRASPLLNSEKAQKPSSSTRTNHAVRASLHQILFG
jgi:hypothetical protein